MAEQDQERQWRRYAGLDLGSKTHPSHLAVIEKRDDGIFYQVKSQWWDPPCALIQVVEETIRLCKRLRIKRLAYDATRGELQTLAEERRLPPTWQAVVFTSESKKQMAGRLAVYLEQGKLKLLPDERQTRSLLQVNALLKAEADESTGHGDAFWSLAMALEAAHSRPSIGHLYSKGSNLSGLTCPEWYYGRIPL